VRHRPTAAFTLTELLAVVAVFFIFCLLFIPARANSTLKSRMFECLNNNRQLCNAWRMYADDNQDRIVYASDDGTGLSNPQNQYAWTLSHMNSNPADRSNWDVAYDIMKRPLWQYNRNPEIYKCPADPSFVGASATGGPRLRIRTYSMNLFMGGFLGTTGGWPSADAYRIFLKTTELTALTPAKGFVFIEMRPDMINWGNFFTDMTGYQTSPSTYTFADYPGKLHDLACSFSFADGHTEMKRWTDPRTIPPETGAFVENPAAPFDQDVAWLQDHATRQK